MTHALTVPTSAQDALDEIKTAWVAKEPVIIGFAVAWLLAQAYALTVTRFHWFTEGQWATVDHWAVPALTVVITALITWGIRELTAPWLKVKPAIESAAQQVIHLIPDAEIGLMSSVAAQAVLAHTNGIVAATQAATVATNGPKPASAGTPTA